MQEGRRDGSRALRALGCALGVVGSGGLAFVACGGGGGSASSGADASIVAPTLAEPNDHDGIQNGSETDVDCGGAGATTPRCDVGAKCASGADCASGACASGRCAAPSASDGVKNGGETGVDCGGPRAPACPDGEPCVARSDCRSRVCLSGSCVAPSPADGVKNGTETDVDCGGPTAPPCDDGRACGAGGDCASGVCAAGACAAPTSSDGVKNGTETDVDCGGPTAPRCAAPKACLLDADCTSGGCDYAGRCALRRSCVRHYGGDTCGLGGPGGRGPAAWESCCETVDVGAGVKLAKYKTTSGRMRAFLESVGGNVRAFVQTERAAGRIPTDAAMLPDWDLYLPKSFAGDPTPPEIAEPPQPDPHQPEGPPIPGIYSSVWNHLGGPIFRDNYFNLSGCAVGAPGGHTYFMSDFVQEQLLGDVPHEHPQEIYDQRPLNCVSYLMAQAFCLWDGGKLPKVTALYAAIGDTGTWPWGVAGPAIKSQGADTVAAWRFPTADDATLRASPNVPPAQMIQPNQSIEYADYDYSYEWPNLKNLDQTVFIAPPGRHRGRGPAGAADVAGTGMELTSTYCTEATPGVCTEGPPSPGHPKNTQIRGPALGSWQGHAYQPDNAWFPNLVTKYGAYFFRCQY